ncbi:hypothetical protein [Streptomyces rhizosphaericus]|uniref:Uncharacterized protein n=1 Tax=Streptomyces rhizosphaericus TaxID=114699 RepID=A0A6G4AJ00_9ACTN|nr:hypothetical protein [Streptomyces rhizosphaericus]NEW72611.1 hypothetical protein [Streptomyces rhizosphaericus]
MTTAEAIATRGRSERNRFLGLPFIPVLIPHCVHHGRARPAVERKLTLV